MFHWVLSVNISRPFLNLHLIYLNEVTIIICMTLPILILLIIILYVISYYTFPLLVCYFVITFLRSLGNWPYGCYQDINNKEKN